MKLSRSVVCLERGEAGGAGGWWRAAAAAGSAGRTTGPWSHDRDCRLRPTPTDRPGRAVCICVPRCAAALGGNFKGGAVSLAPGGCRCRPAQAPTLSSGNLIRRTGRETAWTCVVGEAARRAGAAPLRGGRGTTEPAGATQRTRAPAGARCWCTMRAAARALPAAAAGAAAALSIYLSIYLSI